jgi:ribosomal protein RSM22 (predicted rRNA methylase)
MLSKVLTEFGSKHGFSLIAEARQFFLAEMAGIVNKEESEERKVRIFSPCPHAQACPMLNEKKICRFQSTYWPLNITQNSTLYNKQATKYSYLVLKKTATEPSIFQFQKCIHFQFSNGAF